MRRPARLLSAILLAASAVAGAVGVGATVARGQTACYAPAQAAAHVGEAGCVEGVITNAVYASTATGQPTFLDFGPRFTVVVWGEDRDKFAVAPETLRGSRVRVDGLISSFRNRAEVIVREPEQLGLPRAARPTPAPRTPPPAAAPVAPTAPATVAAFFAPTPSPTPSPTPPTPSPSPPPTASPSPTPESARPSATVTVAPLSAAVEGLLLDVPPPPAPAPPLVQPVMARGGASPLLLAAAALLIGAGTAGAAAYLLRRK